MLTFLCLIYDRTQGFRSKRAALYQRALDILLEEWAAEKRIQEEEVYRGLTTELEKLLLAEIAYRGFGRKLLRNDGKTYEEIVNFIGCSYRSVAHWCICGNPDDLESFKDQRSKGNYRKATDAYIVPGKRSRGRVNVMGGLRSHDRHQQCYFIEQENGDSFYENMLKLNQFVKQEWIEKGNLEIEFERSEIRIVILLDNASYHKKQEVIARL
ncbi:MAG: hypothetical protein HC781_21025 [Leptolyngbyaceae cyanobacterium CSU_1_4]|nr:hypothetical protein [Leptolyngbyaceae cyanobacterium CSU_1_4]